MPFRPSSFLGLPMSVLPTALLWALAGCTAQPDPSVATLPSGQLAPPDSDSDVDTGGVDADGDGSPAGADCDDANPFVSPLNDGVVADRCNGFDEDCDGSIDEDCDATYLGALDDRGYHYLPSVTVDSYAHCDSLDGRSPDPASLYDVATESFILSAIDGIEGVGAGPASVFTGLYHLDFFGNDASGDPEFNWQNGEAFDPVVSPWAPGQPVLLEVLSIEAASIDRASGTYSVVDPTATTAVVCDTRCTTRYLDADGDGDGDAKASFTVCGEYPENSSNNDVDCDDADPGIGEICDPFADEDGDGSLAGEDCDDADPWTFPGAYDRCDYFDEGCNGANTDDCPADSPQLLSTFANGVGTPVTYGTSGYYINGRNRNWSQARAICNTMGGDLWVIDDEVERLLVQSITDDLAYSDNYWIGMHDAEGDDDWVWINGANVSENDSRWFNNDPVSDQDCGRFYAPYADEPFLSDACSDSRDSMCEVDCATYFLDLDGDGVGRDEDPKLFCGTDLPDYAVLVGGDCDDLDPDVGDTIWQVDEDGDGFHGTTYDQCDAPEGDAIIQNDSEDCDEHDVTINIANSVDTCNGLDDDCDGTVDENCGCTYAEGDNTGYLLCDTYLEAPDAAEYCANQGGALVQIDDADENAVVLAMATGRLNERWWIGGTDADEEGVFVGADGLPLAYTNWGPNEPNDGGSGEDCIELRTDGLWNDTGCTVRVNPFVCELPCYDWYADSDGDGFSGGTLVRTSCGLPNAQASTVPDEDCDDADASIHPDADEVCDAADVDEDCDGAADDADDDATGTFTWFLDADSDGFGGDVTITQCETPPDGVVDSTDCDDDADGVNPDAVESCNGVDDDCDGRPDDGMEDRDGDGTCDLIDPCPDDAPDDANRDGVCDSAFVLQPLRMVAGSVGTFLVANGPPNAVVVVGGLVRRRGQRALPVRFGRHTRVSRHHERLLRGDDQDGCRGQWPAAGHGAQHRRHGHPGVVPGHAPGRRGRPDTGGAARRELGGWWGWATLRSPKVTVQALFRRGVPASCSRPPTKTRPEGMTPELRRWTKRDKARRKERPEEVEVAAAK